MNNCTTCGFDNWDSSRLGHAEVMRLRKEVRDLRPFVERCLVAESELRRANALIEDLQADIEQWRAKVEVREERITNLLLRIHGFENMTETLSQHIDRVAATITPGNPVRFLGIESLGSSGSCESLGSYEVAA